MKITTILQTWKRPQYLSEQINAIRNQTIKSDKIIIVMNEGGIKFDLSKYKDCEIIYSSVNRKYHFRFAVGLVEDCDYLFFYDDDTISGTKFYETAIDLINKKECVAVGNGRILYPEEKKWGCPGWGNPCDDATEVDFGGHCWGMKKDYLKYMWYDDPKIYSNCEDMQISFNCFRFNKIRTFVTPHPINERERWSSLKGSVYGSDSVASWITNKNHFQERWEIIDKYIKEGYIPLIKRNV